MGHARKSSLELLPRVGQQEGGRVRKPDVAHLEQEPAIMGTELKGGPREEILLEGEEEPTFIEKLRGHEGFEHCLKRTCFHPLLNI